MTVPEISSKWHGTSEDSLRGSFSGNPVKQFLLLRIVELSLSAKLILYVGVSKYRHRAEQQKYYQVSNVGITLQVWRLLNYQDTSKLSQKFIKANVMYVYKISFSKLYICVQIEKDIFGEGT